MAFPPVAFRERGVRGFVHRPADPPVAGAVLAHGAGSDSRAPVLVRMCEALAEAGVLALRIDLPFRQKRPKGPPHPSMAAADQQGLREAVAAMRGMEVPRIVLGGHSYGGRQASMLAAADPSVADHLLLLAYPLHPPEKPEQLRTAHFPHLRTPSLFVHGGRDPFATEEELRTAIQAIPARVQVMEVPSAGHDLLRMPAAPVAAYFGRAMNMHW